MRHDEDIFVIPPMGSPEFILLLTVASDPQNQQAREDYRVWLASQNDPRAEAFVIEDALLAQTPPQNAEALRLRLGAVLASRHHKKWWRMVSQTGETRQCGAAPTDEQSKLVRFNFACPKRWETLDQTSDPNVRHCTTCERQVHLCSSLDEVKARARLGDCITVATRLVVEAQRDLGKSMTGRPDYDELWAREIFEERE